MPSPKTDDLSRFEWFVRERELIRTKKEFGQPDPLTEDPRLRDYWFPNIRREDDPTSVWFRAAVRDKISDPLQLLLAIVVFRCFGQIRTGELLQDMMLEEGYDTGTMLCALGPQEFKLFNPRWTMYRGPATLAAVAQVMEQIPERLDVTVRLEGSMEAAWHALQEIRGLTPTLAYEIVCDLRHTGWLLQAPDLKTWAAPTIGAVGGIGLILGQQLSADRAADQKDTIRLMKALLATDPSWEMSEAHRAVSLFYVWARTQKPVRRYRWK